VNLLGSELLKLRTTRVPYVLLALTALASGLVTAALVGAGEADADQDDRALALAQGAGFWSMLATVLGILVVTNEYRHGTIMTTFLAEPRRVRVLAAKLATALIGGAVLALGALVALAAVSVPWLWITDQSLALDGQALEAAGRLLLAFSLAAALGAAVGAIILNQVGTIITVFVWFLIVESIIGVVSALLFGDLGEPDPVSPYLPGSALGGIVGGQGADFMLDGGWAALLAASYVAGLSVLGAVSMIRRDP
jgi:ABC-2 type transport system permease protein